MIAFEQLGLTISNFQNNALTVASDQYMFDSQCTFRLNQYSIIDINYNQLKSMQKDEEDQKAGSKQKYDKRKRVHGQHEPEASTCNLKSMVAQCQQFRCKSVDQLAESIKDKLREGAKSNSICKRCHMHYSRFLAFTLKDMEDDNEKVSLNQYQKNIFDDENFLWYQRECQLKSEKGSSGSLPLSR